MLEIGNFEGILSIIYKSISPPFAFFLTCAGFHNLPGKILVKENGINFLFRNRQYINISINYMLKTNLYRRGFTFSWAKSTY